MGKNSEIKFKVTKHAKDRINERGSHVFEYIAAKVFFQGERLDHDLLTKNFIDGLEDEKRLTADYRVYNNLIWVYQKKKDVMSLVTVIPDTWNI